jgi:Resolvase, N terminal domain
LSRSHKMCAAGRFNAARPPFYRGTPGPSSSVPAPLPTDLWDLYCRSMTELVKILRQFRHERSLFPVTICSSVAPVLERKSARAGCLSPSLEARADVPDTAAHGCRCGLNAGEVGGKRWQLLNVRKDVASGKNDEREGFRELLADIQQKKVGVVIVHRLDRLSRNVKDIYTFRDLIKASGVAFVSVTEGFDTTTAMGRAMLRVAARCQRAGPPPHVTAGAAGAVPLSGG